MGISTHILNTATGRPAVGVKVTVARSEPGHRWTVLNSTTSDEDGRCRALLPISETMSPGVYSIHFDTAGYYLAQRTPGLYPYVEIAIEVAPGQAHYHVPLLLTANGYTTYRGS
jgi:5-hydroxyisourate hydrolase